MRKKIQQRAGGERGDKHHQAGNRGSIQVSNRVHITQRVMRTAGIGSENALYF